MIMTKWINGTFFKQNPDKILGEVHTHNPNTGKLLTNRFGQPQPEVRGSIKDITRIKAPDVKRYDHIKPILAASPVIEKPAQQSNRIQKALAATKKQRQQKSKRGYDLLSLEESIKIYNTDVEYKDETGKKHYYTISQEEIKVWVTYQAKNGLYDEEVIRSNAWGKYLVEKPDWKAWQQKGLVAFNGKAYLPEALFYAGNIYQRIAQVQKAKDAIVSEIGEAAYETQLERLEKSKPTPLLITEDPSRKLYLSPFDKIWEDFQTGTYTDGSEPEGSIHWDFYTWLRSLPEEDFTTEDNKFTTAYEIHNYWIQKNRFPNNTPNAEKAAIRRNTSIIGARLFDRFLIEQLSRDDRNRLAATWNSLRNNYQPIAYYKIPVGFQINRKFKGGMLKVRPAQREGVAFMNSRGTGIVAYDVGVGKTMTAILAVIDGFLKGMFKRVLVPVPQKVYKKWIAEINGVFADKDIYEYQTVSGKKKRGKLLHKKGALIAEGILPHIAINDYDNLGVGLINRAVDENGVGITVLENSITMVTYEGLVKIGFGEDTEKELSQRLRTALSQGESGRGKAIQEQKADGWIDKALNKTEVNIEDIGIDAIIVDEAHNFRNLFMEVKGDVGSNGDREQKNFYAGSGGTPSSRAISLFMLNAYVHSQNNLRNTFGLTATPFTNRATEIYSILSLYDYLGMQEFDVYNIAQFCTTFIDETTEDSWTAAGKFEPKPVIRGYNNLPTLQSMVFRSINYKTGEDADIQRPEKVVLPLTHDENGAPLSLKYIVDTKLTPTDLQSGWMKEITLFADGKKSKLDDYYIPDAKGRIPGRVLIALNAARTITFSPYALRLGGNAIFEPKIITPEKFVDGSPKIKYTVECIRSVKRYHEKQGTKISGQVIYSDRGTEWFGHIKEYLVRNVGFKPNEVSEFHGGISKGKREKIKEEFLSGKVKVIIGSSTMREGVDLQKNGSTLYVCYIDWNPTDLHQLFGRIWRFGNKFSHVRLVVPLIENSSDIFTWQKLSEKMSRLNSIWTRSDNTQMFEESELNAEELKKGLINEPEGLAKYQVTEETQAIKSNLRIVEGKLKQLRDATAMRNTYDRLTKRLQSLAEEATTSPQRITYNAKPEQVQKLKEKSITDQKSIYQIVRQYAKLRYDSWQLKGEVDQHIKYKKRIKRLEETVLAPFKLSIEDDFTKVIKDFEQREANMLAQMKEKLSEDYFQQLVQKYQAEKAEEQANRRSIQARVEEFQRLNYLLDCQFGIHSCDIYGRIEVASTSEKVEPAKQEAVKVISTEYTMSPLLRKMLTKPQAGAVREILSGEEREGYIDKVLKPLEQQLQAIPKRQSERKANGNKRSTDYLIAHAKYFLGNMTWYVLEFDGKDEFFTAVHRTGNYDLELGYTSLSELKSTFVSGSGFKQYAEVDFFWTPVYYWELNVEHGFDRKKSRITLADALKKGMEKPLYSYSHKSTEPKKEAISPIEEAIQALAIAKEFSGNKAIEEAIEVLNIALEFA